MNPDNKRTPPARDNDSTDDANGAPKTPSADMQPEDAGTAESGNTDRGSAVEGAMKQTSKTPAERGER